MCKNDEGNSALIPPDSSLCDDLGLYCHWYYSRNKKSEEEKSVFDKFMTLDEWHTFTQGMSEEHFQRVSITFSLCNHYSTQYFVNE